MKYAARINSFISQGKTLEQTFEILSDTDHLHYVDLNYPEHFENHTVDEIRGLLKLNNLKLNAINLRFRRVFVNGDLSNVDEKIHMEALTISQEAINICGDLKGKQVIFWLGHDGNDYAFQNDYDKQWNQIISSIKGVKNENSIKISIEYKPYEERAIAFLDSYGTSYLMAKEIGDHIGITLDVCHAYMKSENPAFIAQQLLKDNKLYNLHMNDGYGRSDDGLMVGSVHPWIALEIMFYLKKYNFDGVIYFDTFPERENAREELKANIEMCRTLEKIVDNYGIENFEKMINSNDSIKFMNFITKLLKGEKLNV